ncbi:hypothetical protein T439DRAFT_318159 [Meredithblackwellia eburnea MCA 4105]
MSSQPSSPPSSSLASSSASLSTNDQPPPPFLSAPSQFDPSSPGSQLLTKTSGHNTRLGVTSDSVHHQPTAQQQGTTMSKSHSFGPDDEVNPFSDPDAVSPLPSPQLYRTLPARLPPSPSAVPPPLGAPVSSPSTTSGPISAVGSSTPALRQPWSARGKVEGWYAAAARSHAVIGGANSPQAAQRRKLGAASQSYAGGPNQSFLHFINALSQEDPDLLESNSAGSESSADEREAEGSPHRHHHQRQKRTSYTSYSPPYPSSGASSRQSSVAPAGRYRTPSYAAASSRFPPIHATLGLSEEEGSEPSSDEDDRMKKSKSITAGEDGEEEDDDPPDFLSPVPAKEREDEEREQSRKGELVNTASTGGGRTETLSGGDAEPHEGLESSSLFAIHRPIAARRRTLRGEDGEVAEAGQYVIHEREGEAEGDEEEEEGETVEKKQDPSVDVPRPPTAKRKKSSPSVKVDRKAKLADKLADIFGLDNEEPVIAEFQCWLFRSVLLQGFAYLTTGHICFYAYLPHKEGITLRSGMLGVRGMTTRRYHRHWFILKDSVLSWYPSATDPYFPDGHIDLHYCTSVESSEKHETHFKVATSDRKWHFSADSKASRDEWVKMLQRVVFRCQNEGESVKIAIPLETVIDIERSSNLEFAETIRIRVYDAEEGFSIEEYWLSYFSDIESALLELTQVLDRYREAHPEQAKTTASIVDTTQKGAQTLGRTKSLSRPTPRSASWSSALSSRLRLFSPIDRVSQSVATLTDRDKSGISTPKRDSSPRRSTDTTRPSTVLSESELDAMPRRSLEDQDHTYPPEPSSSEPPPDLTHDPGARSPSSWGLPSMSSLASTSLASVPEWLRGPSKRVLSAPGAAAPTARIVGRKILEVVSLASVPAGSLDSDQQTGGLLKVEGADGVREDGGESEDEGTGLDEEEKVNAKLRRAFGLTEKERVIAHFHAYLFRGIPIYGKIYISTSFLCFRSVGITGALAKTKMILPLSDIIAVSKHRSYRIGYSGLIVVIRGHEELFFELNSSERRDSCMDHLELQSELVLRQIAEGEAPSDTLEHQRHLDLLDLAASNLSDPDAEGPYPELSSSQAPIMFCSTSSDFVTFRPEKSLRFTCLTIGSRGDVQPYIALCKGLMNEGHKCKIASHGEYRTWVEGHGIEFEEVGGDPAELMQLMIAHDFFTISFMKEAIGRFRGWLDDLLDSAWKACQGADVLIESPSAIAGYHIAEALRIPYYRAFTMPWSRTRAYPHAFAVPDHKMGGSYNYMTYTMFDQIFWRATSGQINRWRKKSLGLRSTNLELMQQHKLPFLYNFSPVIIPPPLDWRENIHVTGYWWLDNPDDSAAKKWQPPTDLLEFLEKAKELEKKVVFIGFGSIIIPDPEEMTRVVTEAVEKAGVFAIIAKGWSDRAISKDATEEERLEQEQQELKEAELMERDFIYKLKSIPHDWLFPRIAAAVHHGGAGTTGASLRAGLPTIIRPFFGDQHFYADRVATLGIGSAIRVMSVENLTTAIVAAVTDEKQIARARDAGEAIRKEDGVGKAIECIYRDLEYARSIIPPPPVRKNRPEETSSTPLPLSSSLGGLARLKSLSRPSSAPPSPHRPGGHSRNGSSDEQDWDIMSATSSKVGADVQPWEDLEESRTSSLQSKSPRRSGSRSGPSSTKGELHTEDEG